MHRRPDLDASMVMSKAWSDAGKNVWDPPQSKYYAKFYVDAWGDGAFERYWVYHETIKWN